METLTSTILWGKVYLWVRRDDGVLALIRPSQGQAIDSPQAEATP